VNRRTALVLATLIAAGLFALGVTAPRTLPDGAADALANAGPLDAPPFGTDPRGRPLLAYAQQGANIVLGPALVAAAVVGAFQDTLNQVLILDVFLPVMAGQSGNTGCQALAVALRGLTLGDIPPGQERRLVWKEGVLGLLNGSLVGLTAGLGMWCYAAMKGYEKSFLLGAVVFMAMTASCIISGLCGAMIPLVLRRFGADPATASSIFLTTATDIVSMGFFLSLASWLVI
jgi:magnesium transporter